MSNETLFGVWRANPTALADLGAVETERGWEVNLSEPESGNLIATFIYATENEANTEIDAALACLNPT